jgi:hypothetical protein
MELELLALDEPQARESARELLERELRLASGARCPHHSLSWA